MVVSGPGVHKRTAGVGQHTWIADRRIQMLRHMLHTSVGQLREEGLAVPVKQILAQCTFALNAMTAIGGVFPQTAVFGRTPPILPDVRVKSMMIRIRRALLMEFHPARELAVQTIAEAASRTRLRRALKTHTRPAAKEMEFRVGDKPSASMARKAWLLLCCALAADIHPLEHASGVQDAGSILPLLPSKAAKFVPCLKFTEHGLQVSCGDRLHLICCQQSHLAAVERSRHQLACSTASLLLWQHTRQHHLHQAMAHE